MGTAAAAAAAAKGAAAALPTAIASIRLASAHEAARRDARRGASGDSLQVL